MSAFQERVRIVLAAIVAAYKKTFEFTRKVAVWLSPPPRFCAALLSLAFVISFLSWAIGDRVTSAVLFFPQERGPALLGELRNVPRTFGTERTAELIASEFLLGPADPRLKPAFPVEAKLESVMFRKGTLYVDIGEEAAIADPPAIKTGVAALEKSLHSALPTLRHIVVTIGGVQPYMEGLPRPDDGAKKSKKN
jgi:hypothetical protein